MKALEADGPVPGPALSSSPPGALAMAVLVAASFAAVDIGAGMPSSRSLMSPHDYADARRAIESGVRLALAECRELQGRDREACRARARGDERVLKAELDATYTGAVNGGINVELARARARFDVARARCAGLAASELGDCLKGARLDRERWVAEVRPSPT